MSDGAAPPKGGHEEAVLGEAARWLLRARDGMDARDRAAFLDWLRANPAHAAAADIVARAWAAAPDAARLGGFAVPPAPAPAIAALRRPVAPRSVRRRRVVGAIAATGAAVAAAVTAIVWLPPTTEAQWTTGATERRAVALADGTRVWLAPRSHLAARIGPLDRQVTLEAGEAAFDVAHQWRRFSVSAGGVRVVDRGTLFTVRNRAGRPVAVTLVHGAVSVRDRANDTVLAEPSPGDRVEVRAGSVRTQRADTDAALAWRDGRLIFADTSLTDALAAFADQGAPHVAMRDPGLGRLRVSGVYAVGDVESFLAALAAIHPVRWTRIGGGYEIAAR